MIRCLHHRKWNTLVGKRAHAFIPQMGKLRLREEKVLSQGHTTDEGKVRGEAPGLPILDPMGQARLKVLVASSPPWEGAGGDHSKEPS